MKKIYKKIINHYGETHQILKSYEELRELQHAIRSKDLDNIKEELADVHNMLNQLHLMYGISKRETKKLMRLKNKRTLERINNGKKVKR